ncbi:MAG: ATP-dependent RNA helicase HrpA [Candidatus Thiodiazotropha sp. (ex Gloverina cf. vestifex)]|nr:ATP-dependent RNA helicase HrpA [Candidatus Thiodiazotropha sp. (ex Gloverina cf. vestifex)]
MQADKHGLHRRLKGLQRRAKSHQPYEEGLSKLWQSIATSQQRLAQRSARQPSPAFPPELPITQRLQEIKNLIEAHQVVILCGETGSGKSTQLPKICLSLGRGVSGYIGHTQPRRIAARSLSARVASELGTEMGDIVGYKVRFNDRIGPQSLVKLMTDGILLAEIQQDPRLSQYDTLIIDEAHERSLNIDFLLGYLKELLPKRPDLKVIITSATIDPQRFSDHFDGAPVIEVSGRTHPVETCYRPPEEESGYERDDVMQQAILDAVDELSRIDRGDILVFLSGEREIRETAETLRKHKLPLTEVLPLYARLSPAEQGKVFKAHGSRRIVLSTNVAETSLTVPGIRYVIDSGFARISRYSHRSKVQRLPVERVSQASADQRKGRCGRVAAGVCIRLYSEEDFESRRAFTEPEIQRTNLASVILQVKLLGFGEIDSFPFIDPPDHRLIKDGYRVLEEIGAVDGERRVTRIGQQLARLPVDPRIGRMLLSAAKTHCLREVMVIAAALTIQDPRDRPMDKQQQADQAHAQYRNEQSDFTAYLNLWAAMETQRRHLSKHKFRQWCRGEFLSWMRIQEWHDIHIQLRTQLHDMGFKESEKEGGYEAIHRALLSGLLSHIGFRSKDRDYLGARNSRFHIFPGSGLFKGQPKWVVAAELVETTKLYARGVAQIDPKWVEQAAGHLVKRGYSEPHWEKKRGQVAGFEKVTLFGLVLVNRRKINFSPIDPVVAREIFIRSALVDGDFHTRAPFWRHNQSLIADVRDREAKARRRDILVDEERIYSFYDERIPMGISTTPDFEKWLRSENKTKPKRLYMSEVDLVREESGSIGKDDFPDSLEINGIQLPLLYHFEPGREGDGVTLLVPQDVLNQITEAKLQWLVPGLLKECVIALIRGLPKSLRRSFVPVPDYADACMKDLHQTDRPLVQVLGERLKSMAGVHIPESAWNEGELPMHLRMQLRVVDSDGKALQESRDLASLKRQYAGQAGSAHRQLSAPDLERHGIRDWDFGSLPSNLSIEQGQISLMGYPSLVDEGESVAIRLIDAEANAKRLHKAGVRRLIMLNLAKDIRYLRKHLPHLEKLRLYYAKVPDAPGDLMAEMQPGLEDELVSHVVDLTFLNNLPKIRDEATFRQRIKGNRGEMVQQANRVCESLDQILEYYHQARKSLAAITQKHWMVSLMDMQQQLNRLVYRGFLSQIPETQLAEYPRYLNGILKRAEKLIHAAGRDQQRMREMTDIQQRWASWEAQCRQAGSVDERAEEIRWQLEELRVSLFAQELGTAFPVSVKRVEKRWEALGL